MPPLSDDPNEELFDTVKEEAVKIPRSWSPSKIPQYQLPDYIKHDPVLFQFFKRLHYDDKNFIAVVVGETGCQPAGSKVLMADGEWKNIEDIKINDFILSPQKNGSNVFSKVRSVTSFMSNNNYIVYKNNHNKLPLYECSSEHKIPLYYLKKNKHKKKGKYIYDGHEWIIKEPTAEDFSKITAYQKKHKYIGLSSFKINNFLNRTNCEIEPYALGAWLGDGYFGKGGLTITSNNPEIIQEINKSYPYSSVRDKQGTTCKSYYYYKKTDFSILLSKYGYFGKKSGTKFILKEALLSDSNYRIRLLAGLIDTDGYYQKGRGGYSIVSKSFQLATDILFLVKSLGGRGTINKITKRIKSIGFEGTYYSINFYLHDMNLPLQVRYKKKDVKSGYLSSNRVAIDLKKSGPKKVYGFELDSPSQWYITDNWMVTHNSGKSCTAINIARALDITPLGNGAFRKNFIIKQAADGKGTPETRVVFGPSQFMNLIKSGLPRGSIIVWDEAGIGNDAQKWNDRKSQLIKHVMQTFRSRNYGIFMTVPDKESITLSTRRLVNCYIDVNKRDETHAYVDIRWLSRARGTEKTMTYYKYPVFKDPISGKLKKVVKYKVPRLNINVEKEYNRIKDNTIQDMYDYYQKELEFMEKELGEKTMDAGSGAAIKLKKFNMATCTDIAKAKIDELRDDDSAISAAKVMYMLSKSGYDCNGSNAKKVVEMLEDYDSLAIA